MKDWNQLCLSHDVFIFTDDTDIESDVDTDFDDAVHVENTQSKSRDQQADMKHRKESNDRCVILHRY